MAVDVVISVALVGRRETTAVLRSGARPGDVLCVTGHLGGAAGGLHLLRGGGDAGRDDGPALELVRRQLRPRARIAEGVVLARLGATAMIDVSDGLALDLDRLLDASGAGCRVELDAVPVDPNLRALPGAAWDALELALAGGEDLELLAALPPDGVERAVAQLDELGTPLVRIGWVTESERLVDGDDLATWRDKGWDHLRNR